MSNRLFLDDFLANEGRAFLGQFLTFLTILHNLNYVMILFRKLPDFSLQKNARILSLVFGKILNLVVFFGLNFSWHNIS